MVVQEGRRVGKRQQAMVYRHVTTTDESLSTYAGLNGISPKTAYDMYSKIVKRGLVERCRCPICGKQHLSWGARVVHLRSEHGWR